MDRFVFIATVAASIGSGLIAGTFFIFSVAIMPALRQLPAETAMTAMKRIDEVIQNAAFLGVFLGTALLSVGLAIWSVIRWNDPGTAYLLAGSLLYLIGSFGVTVVFNVPMNNTLASSDDSGVWKNHAERWTLWNHVRAVASTLAACAFTLSAANWS